MSICFLSNNTVGKLIVYILYPQLSLNRSGYRTYMVVSQSTDDIITIYERSEYTDVR